MRCFRDGPLECFPMLMSGHADVAQLIESGHADVDQLIVRTYCNRSTLITADANLGRLLLVLWLWFLWL